MGNDVIALRADSSTTPVSTAALTTNQTTTTLPTSISEYSAVPLGANGLLTVLVLSIALLN
jgi:hypothetical protein